MDKQTLNYIKNDKLLLVGVICSIAGIVINNVTVIILANIFLAISIYNLIQFKRGK